MRRWPGAAAFAFKTVCAHSWWPASRSAASALPTSLDSRQPLLSNRRDSWAALTRGT